MKLKDEAIPFVYWKVEIESATSESEFNKKEWSFAMLLKAWEL